VYGYFESGLENLRIMDIPTEIIITILGALGSGVGAILVYIKKRLTELDVLKNEITDCKVRVAELETEKKSVREYMKKRAKRATKNLNTEDYD